MLTKMWNKECCMICHYSGKDWKPEKEKTRKGKWSGTRGKKSNYDW